MLSTVDIMLLAISACLSWYAVVRRHRQNVRELGRGRCVSHVNPRTGLVICLNFIIVTVYPYMVAWFPLLFFLIAPN